MSANLDLVRSIVAAWEHGDFSSGEWAHDDIKVERTGGPTAEIAVGRASMAQTMRELLRPWERFRVAAEEYRELDDERVLVLVRLSARGVASGFELDRVRAQGAVVFQLRDGRVRKLVMSGDREQLLADLGLARAS